MTNPDADELEEGETVIVGGLWASPENEVIESMETV